MEHLEQALDPRESPILQSMIEDLESVKKLLLKQYERMTEAFADLTIEVDETQEVKHEALCLYKGTKETYQCTKDVLNKVQEMQTPSSTGQRQGPSQYMNNGIRIDEALKPQDKLSGSMNVEQFRQL